MTTPGERPGTGHLRVGTAQREEALEVLRNAAADERITFDELEGRIPRALHAVTRDDLASVLGDLLGPDALASLLGREAPRGDGPGYTWDDPLVLEGKGWHEFAVVGPWVVPPFLEVHSSIGGVRLDFSRAQAPATVIDLVLVVNDWGTVTIIVPEGWGVDTQGTHAESSMLESRGVRTRARAGMPRIIVRGRASGAVRVRTPTPADAKKASRLLAAGRGGLPALPR